MRRAWILMAMSTLAGAADHIEPMPSSPPEPRSLQLQAAPNVAGRTLNENETADLAEDVKALRKAVERVRAAVAAADADGSSTPAPHPGTDAHAATGSAAHATEAKPGTTPHGDPHVQTPAAASGHGPAVSGHDQPASGTQPTPTAGDGPRRPSVHFGERLTAQRLANGTTLISCALERESIEQVYRDIGKLMAMPVDDTQALSGRRVVSIHLTDVPWEEALDRLLGQVGIAWRAEGHGNVRTLVIFDRDQNNGEKVMERLASRALAQAARSKDPVAAAEAV